MTPNKLPPLPEPAIEITEAGQTSRYFGPVQMYEYAEDTIALRQSQSLPAGAVAWLEAEPGTTLAELCSARDFLTMYRSTLVHVGAREPAKRQPDNVLFPLYPALQADAREKGEAVFRLYPEELARMTHGPSLRAEEEDRLRSIYGDVAIPLYLHSGDYTEAMLLLEKQRELVENLRGQLDDAKADATDGCTEANCERCNTAIHSRGDMRHAGIGTYPATQPAQASEPSSGLERIDGMTFMLHEDPDNADDEPVRLVMAMSHNDTVFCHRVSQGDNGICKPEATHPQPVTPAGGEVEPFGHHFWTMDGTELFEVGATVPGIAHRGITALYTHPPVADAALARLIEAGERIDKLSLVILSSINESDPTFNDRAAAAVLDLRAAIAGAK